MAKASSARRETLESIKNFSNFDGFMERIMREPEPEPSWIGEKPPRPFNLDDSLPPDILSGAGLGPAAPMMPGEQDWYKAEPFRPPINSSTGLPWSDEELGPVHRVPRSGGTNPETGESYPGRGYHIGDESGMYGKTLEYVPERDVLPEGFLRGGYVGRGMRHGGIMSLRRR